MIKKSIKTIAMVGIISICIVGNSLAATTYTTREKINSTGNIVYNDASSGNKVFFDSSDLTTLADEIDDNNAAADTKIETVQNNLNESLNEVQTTLEDTKKSVADGKSLIASAVTKKGVSTASDATFQVMSDNIISMALQQYNSGYGNGYSVGVTAADNRVNSNSVNYKSGYNAGYEANNSANVVFIGNTPDTWYSTDFNWTATSNFKAVFVTCTGQKQHDQGDYWYASSPGSWGYISRQMMINSGTAARTNVMVVAYYNVTAGQTLTASTGYVNRTYAAYGIK